MFDFFWKKGSFEWGISEAITIATLLALGYGLIYKYGYFSAFGMQWYIYSLSANSIILSTLHLLILLILGVVWGGAAKSHRALLISAQIFVMFYLTIFVISSLAKFFALIDEFSIDSHNYLEICLSFIEQVYLFFGQQLFMLVLGLCLTLYMAIVLKHKWSIPLLLAGSLMMLGALGHQKAKTDFWNADENFQQVFLDQADPDEDYYLVDMNDQLALILIKRNDVGQYAHTEMDFRLINSTDLQRIRYKITLHDEQR